MQVICYQCGTQFEKADKEFRRQQREGRNYFFCSRSCTAIYDNKIRHNTPNDGLKPYQRRTKKIELLLGDKLSTAKSRLNKLLMFELAKKCNMENCYRCDAAIENFEEFTIDHKESWLFNDEPAKMFYDMGNIAFSHAKCNYEAMTFVTFFALAGFKRLRVAPPVKAREFNNYTLGFINDEL